MSERLGNFTSSAIGALAKSGKAKGSIGEPFYTYVKEKRRERRTGRSMSKDASGLSLDWGNMCEQIAHDYLGLEYSLVSKDRFKHKLFPWSGMPDGLVDKNTVTDIKCPWTLTSFMDLIECLDEPDIVAALKKANDKYYWQLVSNAILTARDHCELLVFMPRFEMLDEIRQASKEQGYFFHMKEDGALPWLPNECEIPLITKIAFTPSEEDKIFLTERVELATKLLEE